MLLQFSVVEENDYWREIEKKKKVTHQYNDVTRHVEYGVRRYIGNLELTSGQQIVRLIKGWKPAVWRTKIANMTHDDDVESSSQLHLLIPFARVRQLWIVSTMWYPSKGCSSASK